MAKGLKGQEIVLRNLNKAIRRISRRSMAGLIKGAIIIIRDTEDSPPITPVDEGNLRASRYVVTGTGSKGGSFGKFEGDKAAKMTAEHGSLKSKQKTKAAGRPVVVIGFSASYAAAVHNAKGKKFQRSGSGADFLRTSINSNKALIIKVIKEDARIR